MSTPTAPYAMLRALLICKSAYNTEKGATIIDPLHNINVIAPSPNYIADVSFDLFFAIHAVPARSFDVKFTLIFPDETEALLGQAMIGKVGDENPWAVSSFKARMKTLGIHWVAVYLDNVLFAQASLTLSYLKGETQGAASAEGQYILSWPDEIDF